MIRTDKDQVWRRNEDGGMELVSEIEVEREVSETNPTIEEVNIELESTKETLNFVLMSMFT